MPDLKLTPEQTNQLQIAIGNTYENASSLIRQIAGDYTSIAGAAWMGGASMAAVNKQEEFENIWRNLAEILADLAQGISGTTQMVGQQDDDYQQLLNAVDGTGDTGMGNFGRL
ncbi:Proteins of 100 residues with WXG [Saccharopolyspora antimicrobica]|uniref:Proteins of 100 residues with WXG n=1 Tax=Saccharopolyspora antimicrobica TaxID=455193 RepID=A0A1I5G5L0_9PSEU|nr:WXG100 family type VII secretion target [Saccharopolyspora antimicrobica]RKT83918.1 type VII secretion system (Wss) protein ESAT-6 [Saccharopolyspora antimicrobica]SFO31196.1 Proteins of 100 residues with WXG [Saccharopolyspora antimicrobica]